ncbi:hypothetical protein NT017_38930 [Prolixibacter sp. NT017]|nr:hypothetical protein NT017_38930 [Prolixibacter sp. NT017]
MSLSGEGKQAEGLIFQNWGHRPQRKVRNNEGSLKGFHYIYLYGEILFDMKQKIFGI